MQDGEDRMVERGGSMTLSSTPEVSDTDRGRRGRLSTRRLPLVVGGLSLLVVGVVAGFEVTSMGSGSTGELSLDVTISQHRDAVLTAVAQFFNIAFGPLVAPVLLLVVFAALWRRSRFAAVTVVGLTIVGWFSVEVGKAVVGRARPPAASVHALAAETAPDSYPSGHTAFAAAAVFAVVVALLLARRATGPAWALGVPLITVVAASRLYLGVHYLSDVVASVVFAGGSILVAVGVVAPWLLNLLNHNTLRRREPTG